MATLDVTVTQQVNPDLKPFGALELIEIRTLAEILEKKDGVARVVQTMYGGGMVQIMAARMPSSIDENKKIFLMKIKDTTRKKLFGSYCVYKASSTEDRRDFDFSSFTKMMEILPFGLWGEEAYLFSV